VVAPEDRGQAFGTATTGPAINLLRIEENFSAAWQRLAGTYVEHLPWLACAERYDQAHTFFYMDPPCWQTVGYGVDFPFEEYERMADLTRRCKGKVMVSINDHPDIRRAFDGFHFECLDIRYSTTNQRHAKAEVTGELVIMNWTPASLGALFRARELPEVAGLDTGLSRGSVRLTAGGRRHRLPHGLVTKVGGRHNAGLVPDASQGCLMIEKIGHIKNPLTVIALFAGTAEVFGTVVLPFVDPKSQPEFISFLTTFPFFIAFLFFVTLWINHRVLYAPSDYRNEDNFVDNNFTKDRRILNQLAPIPDTEGLDGAQLEKHATGDLALEAEAPKVEPSQAGKGPAEALLQENKSPKEQLLKRYQNSEMYKEDVAVLLQRQLNASYNLSVISKAMPNLTFDIVLNSTSLNCVGKISYVTKSNMEKMVNEINRWYFAVDAFRCSLSEAEQAKFKCVVCIVHSDLSIAEVIQLERTLESLSLQVPFHISIQEYSADELIERTRGRLSI